MKTLTKLFGMFVIMMSIAIMTVPQNAKAQTSVSFQVFYDDLSPYGYWVNNSSYGYVWIPNYGPEFIPYHSNGYWAYTDYGWTWVSYYRWGWAPFHYGRWAYDDIYGWFWVPDDIWGPAWVCWRTSPGFYGWAPLAPGISFAVSIGGTYNPPPNYWVFVSGTYMGSPNIYQYYSPRSSNSGFISNSRVINNTYKNTYIAGPERSDVEKISKSEIKQLSIKETNKPGQSVNGNNLTIYKPDVSKSKSDNVKPAKISDLKNDVTPMSERKGGKQFQKNNEFDNKEPILKKGEMKEEKAPAKEEKMEKQKENKMEPKMKEPKNAPILPNKGMKKGDRSHHNDDVYDNEPKNAPIFPNNKEIKKQDQPPKNVQPKMNEPKNYPVQPHREIKRMDQPPRNVQPNMNPKPNQNPGGPPHNNNQGGGGNRRPR